MSSLTILYAIASGLYKETWGGKCVGLVKYPHSLAVIDEAHGADKEVSASYEDRFCLYVLHF